MKDINKTEKRRKFLQISAIGGLMGLAVRALPFGIGKPKAEKTEEPITINVKSHPLAVKRNTKG